MDGKRTQYVMICVSLEAYSALSTPIVVLIRFISRLKQQFGNEMCLNLKICKCLVSN